MSSVESLREFVSERLTAAAEEIFGVFKQTIVEYEEEIDRQRRLLDVVWKPEIQSHQIELSQQHVCTEEEVLTDQQLCIQERNPNLGQEDLEPPQIKEEQEELCTSQEGEELELKQETETFMFTPSYEESDHSEDQTLNLIKPDKTLSAAEMESDVNLALKLASKTDDQLLSRNSHVKCDTSGEDSQSRLNIQMGMHTGEKSYLSETCGKEIRHDSGLLDHRIHTEIPQQRVCTDEVLTDQQLCIKDRNSSLEQEDPEPPQIKEEQEEFCTSQEGEPLELKQETDTFVFTYGESDHSEPEQNDDHQLLSHNSLVAESQDQKGGEHTHTEKEEERSFKCDACGKAFKYKSMFNAHMRIHTGEKPYPCNTCGKRFSRLSDLKKHVRIHTSEKPFTCRTCGTAFRLSRELTVHIRRAHTSEKPYICKTCGKRFCHPSALDSHVRIHTDEKPFSCKICGIDCICDSALEIHMRVHTGEKPYLCNTCGKRFCRMPNLKKHIRIHTNEKPFTCKTCGATFRLNRELTVHMRRAHTSEKVYLCCGKSYFDMSELAQHIRSHTGK